MRRRVAGRGVSRRVARSERERQPGGLAIAVSNAVAHANAERRRGEPFLGAGQPDAVRVAKPDAGSVRQRFSQFVAVGREPASSRAAVRRSAPG